MQSVYQPWVTQLRTVYLANEIIGLSILTTKAANMQSPNFARVVGWISEAWNELYSNLIARWFHLFGITSRSRADYGSLLKYLIRTNELIDTIIDDEIVSCDVFGENGDEWDG